MATSKRLFGVETM